MPVAPNSQVVEAQFRYTCTNEQVENVLWFRTNPPGPVSPLNLPILAAALFQWYEIALQPLQHADCILREIYLRQALVDAAAEYTLNADATAVGTAAGEAAPNNVSLVVSFRTGLSGRSRRGRNYSVGMTKSQIVGNTATTAYYNSLLAAYEQLPTALEVEDNYRHIVYSQYVNGEPRVAGITNDVVTYVITDTNLDSQRRRLAGRGS